jgi:hypothetical protein
VRGSNRAPMALQQYRMRHRRKDFTMTRHCFGPVFLAVCLCVLAAGCGRDSVDRNRSAVRINEVSPKNGSVQDIDGNTSDWIELYNASDTDFDLAGCYISDSANNRFKYQFPASDAGAGITYSVPAKGVLAGFADGISGPGKEDEPHFDFKLSDTGEGVWLSNPAGYLIDSVQFGWVPPNDAGTKRTSLARFPDGTGDFQWCSESTFDELNGDHCSGEVL